MRTVTSYIKLSWTGSTKEYQYETFTIGRFATCIPDYWHYSHDFKHGDAMTAMPKPLIKVQCRHSYGIKRIYPVNPVAKLVAELTGRVTLSPNDLIVCTKLGFEVEWVPESINLNTEETES